MKNKITMTQMMQGTNKLHAQGKRFTHIGVGPMSYNLLRAGLELAKEKDFPLILIASRNQVDSDRFGGGYVCGFDQKRFVETTSKIADEIGFDGLCYFCRDHGGPWQRDKEMINCPRTRQWKSDCNRILTTRRQALTFSISTRRKTRIARASYPFPPCSIERYI